MPINFPMLALSAANPGLLPLAFSNVFNPSRSPYAYGGTVNHNHRGHVEHSFKPGSGEELRGIAVSKQRAIAAYERALAQYDAFQQANQTVIDEIMEKQKQEYAEEAAMLEKKRQEREAKRSEYEIKKARHEYLEQESHSFFGLSSKHKQELEELRKLSREADWFGDRMDIHYDLMIRRRHFETQAKIKVERKKIVETLAIASVAENMLYLSRADVLQIHAMETDTWLPKTKLARMVESRSTHL